MQVAVTGASGFIGRHLVAHLAGKGHDLRLLVHHRPIDGPGAALQGSLGDPDSLKRFLEGVEVVFHLASALGGRGLATRDYMEVNRDGTRNILAAAENAGVRKFVHVSSAGVYGRSSGLVPLKESDAHHPQDRYERSKEEGEAAALASRLDVSVVRPGWVYGEGDRRTFRLIQRIHSGPFFIAGAGNVRHAVIHVSDVVRLLDLAARKGKRGEAYNSGGENLSVREICTAIAAALGKKGRYPRLPMAMVVPAAQISQWLFRAIGRDSPLTPAMLAFFQRGKPLDGALAKKRLGFVPRVPFSEGIRRALAWYRAQGWL